MTTDAPAMAPANPLDGPGRSARATIQLYLALLIALLALGAPYGGLIGVPISFILKNRLHLDPDQLSNFKLYASLPLYFSFLPGFIRDVSSPFGLKDRGFMLLFGAISAMLYATFAFIEITYLTLLIATLLLTTTYLFVLAAQNGLSSAVGQRHAMSGRISALWQIVIAIPAILALLLGGAISDFLESSSDRLVAGLLYATGAAIMLLIALYGFWRPPPVFDPFSAETHRASHPLADLRRLLRHRPIYPALLIWLLWQFAPGVDTPLMFYLQDVLHGTDLQWGQWNAIFAASFIPSFLTFALLCRKFPLRTLLLWGTVVAIPQMLPLLFIHTMTGALLAAIPIGLMGGVATAAYLDLIIRSCPRGLEGVTLMMANALFFIATRFGDRLGTELYHRFGGFSACVIAITAVYAMILPALRLVPARLVATADGRQPDQFATIVGP